MNSLRTMLMVFLRRRRGGLLGEAGDVTGWVGSESSVRATPPPSQISVTFNLFIKILVMNLEKKIYKDFLNPGAVIAVRNDWQNVI